MLMPPVPEHGSRTAFLEAIVVGPDGAVRIIFALELESEPLQGRGIAPKVYGDMPGSPLAILQRTKPRWGDANRFSALSIQRVGAT
jgi:hypothetical protein